LIQAGVHAKTISSRLGHSGIAITMDRYGHLFDSQDAEAAQKVDVVLRGAWGADDAPGAGEA
jgi:integrase